MLRVISSWNRFIVAFAFALVVLGCGSGSTTASTDGGTGGASSLGSGGSGGSTTTSTDSPGPDASDGSPGASSVVVSTIDQNNAPVAAIPVVVNDAAGAVALVTQSGADGTVPVMVPQGGSVSVFSSYDLSFDVQAVVEPPDGATVFFMVYTLASAPPPEKTTFDVTFAQIPQGTEEIFVYSCATTATAGGPSFSVTVDNSPCSQQATSSFLAIASDVHSGTVLMRPSAPVRISPLRDR